MFIDTTTTSRMKESIANITSLSVYDLDGVGGIANDEKVYYKFAKSLLTEGFECFPNEILLYHLARRLDGDDNRALNLKTLLLTENAITYFLKKYNLTFTQEEHQVIIENKGMPIHLEEMKPSREIKYLKARLGCCSTGADLCVNGFVFKDGIEKSVYYNLLKECPEFIKNLAIAFDKPDMLADYYNNSTYYCFTYIIPMTQIIFDNASNLLDDEKNIHMLALALQRLDEKWRDPNYSHDIYIRLKDCDYINSDQLIHKDIL